MKCAVVEFVKVIDDFLSGDIGPYDWDDFISVSLDDPELDYIRLQCAQASERFPAKETGQYCSDEGAKYLRSLADGLRIRLTSR